jgi:hypothetical protein
MDIEISVLNERDLAFAIVQRALRIEPMLLDDKAVNVI